MRLAHDVARDLLHSAYVGFLGGDSSDSRCAIASAFGIARSTSTPAPARTRRHTALPLYCIHSGKETTMTPLAVRSFHINVPVAG
jgi:hypothetical protein